MRWSRWLHNTMHATAPREEGVTAQLLIHHGTTLLKSKIGENVLLAPNSALSGTIQHGTWSSCAVCWDVGLASAWQWTRSQCFSLTPRPVAIHPAHRWTATEEYLTALHEVIGTREIQTRSLHNGKKKIPKMSPLIVLESKTFNLLATKLCGCSSWKHYSKHWGGGGSG